MKMGFYHNTTYSFWDQRYPNEEWVEYMNNSIKELVDLYDPAILWGDVRIGPARDSVWNPLGIDHWNNKELLAYYYNHAKDPNRVVANDRWGKSQVGPYLGDYQTPEREKMDTITSDKWETCMTITGSASWGYDKSKKPQDYWSVNALVDYLVDIVSKNGNLLLNIGPRADGIIPDIMRERLLGIGRWLEVNGEAIYGTDYWKTYGQGNIRFTRKGENTLYAIALEWPGKQVTIQSLNENIDRKIQEVSILGDNEKLEWNMSEKGLTIETPQKRPCKYAYSFKIVFKD
jgi:alpha-L-fucosidase